MDLVLLFLLIVLNGIFAMCEIAVVSSRTARLQRLADSASPGARPPLAIHSHRVRFRSAWSSTSADGWPNAG